MWRSESSAKLEKREVRSKEARWWKRGDQRSISGGGDGAAEAWRWKGRVQLTLQKSHIPVPWGVAPPCPGPLKKSEAGGQSSGRMGWSVGQEAGGAGQGVEKQ